MSPEVFLGSEFDRDIQNWAKILGTYGVNGVPTRKKEFHAPGVSTHARSTSMSGLFTMPIYTDC